MTSQWYVVEFRKEEDPKSRGPHVIQAERIRRNESCSVDEVEVKWSILDANGEVAESYFLGTSLFHGSKKECGEFKDKLRHNREVAEVNNKESRDRKKSAKLLDLQADAETLVYDVDATGDLSLSGPPKKKSKKPTTKKDASKSKEHLFNVEYCKG
jgi:hypothetical protein